VRAKVVDDANVRAKVERRRLDRNTSPSYERNAVEDICSHSPMKASATLRRFKTAGRSAKLPQALRMFVKTV